MGAETHKETSGLLSIGALSRATGVPADTLRTWERRYGFPAPERLGSGHRRYSLTTLERLRLVTQAIGLGLRPSAVLPASAEELRTLVVEARGTGDRAPAQSVPVIAVMWQQWLEHVASFEGRAFDRQLRIAWGQLGSERFLSELVGPFLRELGARWERGELGVRHEHFGSERLREFLVTQWRPPSDAATGPTCVLATLSGEEHVLGLHMAAVVLALANVRIVFLGADTPVDEIAKAVAQYGAQAVVLSAAESGSTGAYDTALSALRDALPPAVPVVVGGRGFSDRVHGIVKLDTFEALEHWSRELGSRDEQLLTD
jgi:MerR family transcriptional regulator, light-induced transcriptional regulator